jgi:tetratricopeptide (TPR) repeat protein
VFGCIAPENLLNHESSKLCYELYFIPTLVRLSELYSRIKLFHNAESCFQEGYSVVARISGADSLTYASILYRQALLDRDMGRYDRAESLFTKSLEIIKKEGGEEHPDVAKTLNSLGVLFLKVEDYIRAKPLFKHALSVWRKAGLENTPAFAACLNNLGLIYKELGYYYKAYFSLKQAFGIRLKELGEEHPEVAESLTNLASYWKAARQEDKSESLCGKAIEIWRKAGMENGKFAVCLRLMGSICALRGLYDKAASNYLKSLDVSDRILGKSHPDRVPTMFELALVYIAQKRVDEALRLMTEAISIEDKELPIIFSFGSEIQRMLYLKSLVRTYHLYLSITINSFIHDENIVLSALDLVLKRKALGAEALHQLRIGISRNPRLKAKVHDLNQLRMLIQENQMAASASEASNADQHTYLNQLLGQKESLEKDIASELPEIKLQDRLSSLNVTTIFNAVPTDSLLVEFVKYQHLDFVKLQDKNDYHFESRYAAFILDSKNRTRTHKCTCCRFGTCGDYRQRDRYLPCLDKR